MPSRTFNPYLADDDVAVDAATWESYAINGRCHEVLLTPVSGLLQVFFNDQNNTPSLKLHKETEIENTDGLLKHLWLYSTDGGAINIKQIGRQPGEIVK